MGSNFNKNSQIKILKPHAHLRNIGRNSSKFPTNPTKDIEGVDKISDLQVYVSMGNYSVNNSSIKNPKPHAHLYIIGRKST